MTATATCRSAFSVVQRALSANVRGLRAERGLTQKRLAEVAAIDERHVQRIEAGRANPGISTLCALAGALGTTAARLITVGVDTAGEAGSGR